MAGHANHTRTARARKVAGSRALVPLSPVVGGLSPEPAGDDLLHPGAELLR